MSMMGMDYRLVCGACGLESEGYPLVPFHQTFLGDLRLAVVDLGLGAFGTLDLYLRPEQRSGPEALPVRDIAARWSSADRIVVVPQGLDGKIWPEAVPCPACGALLAGQRGF